MLIIIFMFLMEGGGGRMMPGSAQYKMDHLVSLMMAEDKIEPSEQFDTVLKTLDPAEVIVFLIYVP